MVHIKYDPCVLFLEFVQLFSRIEQSVLKLIDIILLED